MSGTTKLTKGVLLLVIFVMGVEASGDTLILKSGVKLTNGKVTERRRNYSFVGQKGTERIFRRDEVLRVIKKEVNWPKPPVKKAFDSFRKSVGLAKKAFDAAAAKAEPKNAVEPDKAKPEQDAESPEKEAAKPEQDARNPDVEKALEYFGKSTALAKKTFAHALANARKRQASERKKDTAGNARRARKAAAIYRAVRGAWNRMGRKPNRSMTRIVQTSPVPFDITINGNNIERQLANAKEDAADAARRLKLKLPLPATEKLHQRDKTKFVEAKKAIEKAGEVLRDATIELHPPPDQPGIKPDIKKCRDALSKAMKDLDLALRRIISLRNNVPR